MKLKYYFTLLSLLSFMACSDDSPSTPDTPDQPDVPNSVEKLVTINAGKIYQTITGFGASDCWNPSYVGKYWTNSRDKITELLFSSEIQAGSPKGIGLSMWRVNLGGGTAEQGDASGITDKSRRAESYLTNDLTLDWNRCEVRLRKYRPFQQYTTRTIYTERQRFLQPRRSIKPEKRLLR